MGGTEPGSLGGDGAGPLTGDQVAASLMKHNYFPQHASDGSEMPPTVNSEQFKPELLAEIVGLDSGANLSYNFVSYGLTRFDLSIRNAGIPHPAPYARLVARIRENWGQLQHVAENRHSALRPILRNDGRIFAMGYAEQPRVDFSSDAVERFGRKFVVKTDIKNFFPSIYTHAIPWALATKPVAKSTRSRKIWYNALDEAFRKCQRDQTNGLPIGPGTSSVGAEILLAPVDSELAKRGFSDFHRFIDDYTYYADSYDEGQRFVDELSLLLREYELQINGAKTSIQILPQVSRPDWLSRIVLARPKDISGKNQLRAYLDMALGLAQTQPGGSVLKYAIKSLVPANQDEETNEILARLLVNLSYHRPGLMPLLNDIFDYSPVGPKSFEPELNDLARRAALYGRSDAAAWAIHMLLRDDALVEEKTVDELLRRVETVSLSLLAKAERLTNSQGQGAVEIVQGARDVAEGTSVWLLEYVLGQHGSVSHASDVLSYLDYAGVDFITYAK